MAEEARLKSPAYAVVRRSGAADEWSDIAPRLNALHLLSTCAAAESDPPSATVKIVAKRTEVYLDGSEGRRLLAAVRASPNPNDTEGGGVRTYANVLDRLFAQTQSSVRQRLLAPPFNLSGATAGALRFNSWSLIVQEPGVDTPPQWPHFDILDGGQGVVALQDDLTPTLVYPSVGEEGRRALYLNAASVSGHCTPRELQVLREAEARSFPANEVIRNLIATNAAVDRNQLERMMVPASPDNLNMFDFSLLVGPVLHAGPPLIESTLATPPRGRAVLFFAFNLPGHPKYNTDKQYGPVHTAIEFNSAERIVEMCDQYSDYDPLQFFSEDLEDVRVIVQQFLQGPRTERDKQQAVLDVRTAFTEKDV